MGILGTYPSNHEVTLRIARGGEELDLRTTLLEAGSQAYLGLRTEAREAGGLRVTEVSPGSPAERGGLKAEDVLLLFDGKKLESQLDLKTFVQARSAGDEVPISLLREGNTIEVKVRLGGRNS